MFTHLGRMLITALAFSFGTVAIANGLKTPTGPVVLTVLGSIEQTNRDAVAEFDRDMLFELDWRSIESYTTWTDGPNQFSGATLASVLDAVGATGDEIIATALNDYRVNIPLSDAAEFDPMLAMEFNGVQMRIRDKGPIWIVYPQGEDQSEDREHDEKMIWQLKSIEIVNKTAK